MEIQFTRKFEAAHRFIEGENKGSICSQPHGHTWYVTVTLGTKTPKLMNQTTNTIIPFEKAKKKWKEWIDHCVDHAFFFNVRDPLLEFMLKENPKGRHLIMPGDPTTEMVAATFKAKFENFLQEIDSNLICTEIHIQETETNAIRFNGNSQEHLPPDFTTPKTFWWNRADLSINDLPK